MAGNTIVAAGRRKGAAGPKAHAGLTGRWREQADDELRRVAQAIDSGDVSIIGGSAAPDGTAGIVLAIDQLQREPDYRGALQRWFGQVDIGGRLVLAVPDARGDGTQAPAGPLQPGPRDYTAETLLSAIEESLGPGGYAVRHLAEAAADPSAGDGAHILAIVEKLERPARRDTTPERPIKLLDRDFEARRTRVESWGGRRAERVLILKLDHLGDFIMGLPALRRARETFADAHITLVVGAWNAEMARDSGVADELVLFDAFPRNSSEEKVDLESKAAMFKQAVPGRFDLAIDLRPDPDTRFYLQHVDAAVRAGLGTRAQFPFLDVFVPIDSTRHDWETGREDLLDPGGFNAQPFCTKSRFRIHCPADRLTSRYGAVIWGPYWRLRPGNYFFEPFFEFEKPHDGMLMIDIALNYEGAVAKAITAESQARLEFTVDRPSSPFEFRVHEAAGHKPLGFSFYGGRLVRQGAESVLHQSEYMSLLIELIAMRLQEGGLLSEVGGDR